MENVKNSKEPEMSMLNDEEMETITGGDYGDTTNWTSADLVKWRYPVGMRVEIYDNIFHTTTERAVILRQVVHEETLCRSFQTVYQAGYEIRYLKSGKTEETTEVWIQHPGT